MASKTQLNRWVAALDKRLAAVGKERDKLDEVIEEMTTLREDCNEAHEALQTARDALSRLV